MDCEINGKSANNLVLNSDFHHNQDPLTSPKYENADGLEICYIPAGLTNTVKGCRFWNNSDDGIDLWQNDGAVHNRQSAGHGIMAIYLTHTPLLVTVTDSNLVLLLLTTEQKS